MRPYMAGDGPIHKIAVLVASAAALGAVCLPAWATSQTRVTRSGMRTRSPERFLPLGLSKELRRSRKESVRVFLLVRGGGRAFAVAAREREALAPSPGVAERVALRRATGRYLKKY